MYTVIVLCVTFSLGRMAWEKTGPSQSERVEKALQELVLPRAQTKQPTLAHSQPHSSHFPGVPAFVLQHHEVVKGPN